MELNPASPYANVDYRTVQSALKLTTDSQQPFVLAAPDQEPMPIKKTLSADEQAAELKGKFQEFVGQTFFTELIKSLRTSQQGAAYFNGGRAEEVFQGQFDQMMSEHLSQASASSISDPMFELFQLGRMSG